MNETLKQLIRNEIAENPIDNWHGVSKENISNYLLNPILKNYVDSWSGEIVSLWLVFDEDKSSLRNGYQIVYEEGENKFGLATKGSIPDKGVGTVIGFYGTFIETLNGM